MSCMACKNFRRVVLLAFAVKSERGIHAARTPSRRERAGSGQRRTKIEQQSSHPDSRSEAVRAPSSDFNYRLAPAVLLDLVMQRNPVDIENLRGARLVPTGLLEHVQDVSFFDVLERGRRMRAEFPLAWRP